MFVNTNRPVSEDLTFIRKSEDFRYEETEEGDYNDNSSG